MRLLLAIFLALSTSCFAAGKVGEPQSYSEQLDKSNIEFLRQLAKNIETAGYERVQVVPEMFVAIAIHEGKRTVLIVNSNTLKTVEFARGIEALTVEGTEIAPPETSLPKLR
jgi:hypothetical protein